MWNRGFYHARAILRAVIAPRALLITAKGASSITFRGEGSGQDSDDFISRNAFNERDGCCSKTRVVIDDFGVPPTPVCLLLSVLLRNLSRKIMDCWKGRNFGRLSAALGMTCVNIVYGFKYWDQFFILLSGLNDYCRSGISSLSPEVHVHFIFIRIYIHKLRRLLNLRVRVFW